MVVGKTSVFCFLSLSSLNAAGLGAWWVSRCDLGVPLCRLVDCSGWRGFEERFARFTIGGIVLYSAIQKGPFIVVLCRRGAPQKLSKQLLQKILSHEHL